MSQERINLFMMFAVGYWVGQFKHGVFPLIISLVLMSIDYWAIGKLMKYYKEKKLRNKIIENL